MARRTSAPPARRPCSSRRPRPSRSRSGSCSPIRTRAYVRAKTPSWMTCAPIRVSGHEPEHRVDLPRAAEDVDRPAREDDHPDDPEQEQEASWDEVQPARAVQEHEANVAPGVREAVQLRLPDPRVVVDRNLADRHAAAIRLEDHLRGELHPGRVQVETGRGLLADRAHPAVGVGDLDAEEEVEHPGQDRVSDEPVQERHRIAVDRPLEAGAHDEVVALLEPVDERRRAPGAGTSRRRRP